MIKGLTDTKCGLSSLISLKDTNLEVFGNIIQDLIVSCSSSQVEQVVSKLILLFVVSTWVENDLDTFQVWLFAGYSEHQWSISVEFPLERGFALAELVSLLKCHQINVDQQVLDDLSEQVRLTTPCSCSENIWNDNILSLFWEANWSAVRKRATMLENSFENLIITWLSSWDGEWSHSIIWLVLEFIWR